MIFSFSKVIFSFLKTTENYLQNVFWAQMELAFPRATSVRLAKKRALASKTVKALPKN